MRITLVSSSRPFPLLGAGAFASRSRGHDVVPDHRGPKEDGQGGGSPSRAGRHQVRAEGDPDSGFCLSLLFLLRIASAAGCCCNPVLSLSFSRGAVLVCDDDVPLVRHKGSGLESPSPVRFLVRSLVFPEKRGRGEIRDSLWASRCCWAHFVHPSLSPCV